MKHSYSVSLNFSVSQPKCHWILLSEITACYFLRQPVASAPAVFKLQVSFRIIHKGEGLQTIHKAAALGHASTRLGLRLWLSLFPELLISPAIINGDTLHKAEFAWAHVQKGGTYMLLSWVLVEHLHLAALEVRGRVQCVSSPDAGHGAAVEVPKGLWVFGETDKALQGGVIVSTASEGQHTITVLFPHILLGVQDEGGSSLGTDKDASIRLHGVGGDIHAVEWR